MTELTGARYLSNELPKNTDAEGNTWLSLLDDSVAHGQHPKIYVVHSGSFSPSTIALPPTKAFVSSLVDEASVVASNSYSSGHLGSDRSFYYVSDNDLPALANKSVAERREAAIALIAKNMATVEGSELKRPVMCVYQTQDSVEIFAGEDLASKANHEIMKGDFGYVNKPSEWMHCSCCDSRAEAGHLYCTEPGQDYNMETIAALATDEQIAEAKKRGITKASTTSHSKCGGFNGLATAIVESMENGNKPIALGDLHAWLAPAEPAARTAIEFAEKKLGGLRNEKNEIKPEVFAMVELWVNQKQGEKLIKAFGKENVLVRYYDIRNGHRALYDLNPSATLEETFQYAQDPSKLKLVSSPASKWDASKTPVLTKEVINNRLLLQQKINEGFEAQIRNNPSLVQTNHHTLH